MKCFDKMKHLFTAIKHCFSKKVVTLRAIYVSLSPSFEKRDIKLYKYLS